jgi:hypothetical protein
MKLHHSDAVALVEIWSGLKNYIPAKDQKQAAEQYIASLEDRGLADFSVDNAEFYGVCGVFDSALRAYCEEQGYHDDYIDDDEYDWDNS